MRPGALIEYRLALHRMPVRWLTRIEEWTPGRSFVDAQVRGPYRLWHHTHTFAARDGGTLVGDQVRYALPLGPLGAAAHTAFVRRDLERIFGLPPLSDRRHDASQSKVRRRMKTFWRLLGFLRPYRNGVIVSFVLAAAAMGVGVLIPYLVGRTVDEIGNGGDNLWPLAAAVAAAGVLRLAFSVNRRLVAGRVSLGVEYDLRNRIYGHLHSLELAFFDGQQTGQLMSRSTVDLQAVRFFLGYGLIFIVQSLLTIVIAAGVMFVVDPRLAAVALAPMPFVIWVAFRYGRLNRPGHAGGAAAHRRAHRRGRGERGRRPRRQGVRAGGAPAAALQPRRRAGVRPVDGLHPAARVLQPAASASSPSSAWPACCSSAATRRSTARSRSASSSPSTATC